MRLMFTTQPDGEITQVDFWTAYKDAFVPYIDSVPMHSASDLIKTVATVFPHAHAVCVDGPPPRWVMRGVARAPEHRHACAWERGACAAVPLARRADLVAHVRQHLVERVEDALPCLWASCAHPPAPKPALWPHVLTHLAGALPAAAAAVPSVPAPAPTLALTRAANEPPQATLTALLCIRLLFHLSFSAAGAAPRVDGDHFGFPGVVEEDDDDAELATATAAPAAGEEEGARRGRTAFVGARHLMERVRIKDDALMGWLAEMIEVATYMNTSTL
jgi:chromatin structure-remodeling complex subunit RSC9